MPGIVGLITRMPRQRAEAQLSSMLTTLCHEDFYTTGTWIDENLGAYVGWAARKDSFSAQMPLISDQQNTVLVFAGEEFSDTGTHGRLASDGRESNNKKYLVDLAERDSTFPATLNGRFHGLVVDRSRGMATLFNDRYGMQRLYVHEAKEAVYFAAEAKALLAVRPVLRNLNLRSMGEFVSCGCVLENRTLFEDIQVFPPASAWVFRYGSLEQKSSYFQTKEWEEQEALDADTYYEELKGIFAQNLPRYFNGGERVAMSLTGGLDTRMIMAWQDAAPRSLSCYTFGGSLRDCQDVVVARQVAQACKQPHEVLFVEPEFLTNFSKYAERAVYLTDGCVTVNRAADLFLNERARRIAPVRMTGNYGGEVLRRIRAFKPVQPESDLFRPEFLNYIAQAERTYSDISQVHPLSFAVFRQAPWHHYGLLALEQSQLSLRSPFLDNDFVRMVFRAPASVCANDEVCLKLIADGDAGLMRIRTDRGVAGEQQGLVSAMLREYLEFTFKAEYAYDNGMPQWLARIDHLLSPLQLERVFLGRHKFCHYRVWYRDLLASYVEEMLLDPRTLSRPYLNPRTVENMVLHHTRGDRNYTSAIHQVLTLELIHRLFFDPAPRTLND